VVPVLIVIAITTFLAAQPQPARSSDAEVLQFMQDLVRMDTSNGNETKAAQYIKAVFDKEGIPSEIFESAPGRGNIVARLKGNGTRKPVLLMAHTDVVGVDRTKWTVDPFAAIVKDDYLYGRGSDDDKSLVAAHLGPQE
jgi:acetylornithine deacetylase/succinyl-diaminopimelate desuccinylase-like protein